MPLKKKQVSEYPLATSFKDMFTFGVDKTNKNFKVDLSLIETTSQQSNDASKEATGAAKVSKELSDNPTKIGSDYFVYVYDLKTHNYIKTDINVKGPKGDPGTGGGGGVAFYASLEERDADIPSLPVGTTTVVLDEHKRTTPVNGETIQVLDFNTDHTPNLLAYMPTTSVETQIFLGAFGANEETGEMAAAMIVIAINADGSISSTANVPDRILAIGDGMKEFTPLYSTTTGSIVFGEAASTFKSGWNTNYYEFTKPEIANINNDLWTDVDECFKNSFDKVAVSIVADGGILIDNTAQKKSENRNEFNICENTGAFVGVILLTSSSSNDMEILDQDQIRTSLRYDELIEAVKAKDNIVANCDLDGQYFRVSISSATYFSNFEQGSQSSQLGLTECVVFDSVISVAGTYGLKDNRRIVNIVGKKPDGSLIWIIRRSEGANVSPDQIREMVGIDYSLLTEQIVPGEYWLCKDGVRREVFQQTFVLSKIMTVTIDNLAYWDFILINSGIQEAISVIGNKQIADEEIGILNNWKNEFMWYIETLRGQLSIGGRAPISALNKEIKLNVTIKYTKK